MQKDNRTFVVFRKYDDGQIIALFPYQFETFRLNASYMWEGQHAPADYYGTINETKPAHEVEYNDLRAELESLGYNLVIIEKVNRMAFNRAFSAFYEKYFKQVA